MNNGLVPRRGVKNPLGQLLLGIVVAACVVGWARVASAQQPGASETAVVFPAPTMSAILKGPDGPAELQLREEQLEAMLYGKPVEAALGDSANSSGRYHHLSARARWRLEDQTGITVIPGPAGPAVRFITGYAAFDGIAPVGSGDKWTLLMWVRPEEGDWGYTNRGTGPPAPQKMRPLILSIGNDTQLLWAVRLCQMRPEIQIGEWRAWTNARLHLGQWAHLAVVRDGQDVGVYVNGKAVELLPALAIHPLSDKDQVPESDTPGPVAVAGAMANGPFGLLSLGGYPEAVSFTHSRDGTRYVRLCDKFIGAIGSLQLNDAAWTAEQVAEAAGAGRSQAEKLSVRYCVLDDPVVGAVGRRADKADESPAEYLRRIAWWREAKFGFFMHWGVNSLTGEEISWSRGDKPGQTPIEVYDNLYKRFDPTKYDPAAWAEQIKAGGFKYAVLTSKHHDGFCMWHTETNQYNITCTPFKKDVVAMYAKAFREAGIKVGFYFSWPDWWYEDKITKEQGRDVWLRIRTAYKLEQLRELCTNYGPINVFWFDGGGEFLSVTNLQPKAVVNDRGAGGDHYTPENFIPDFPFINPNGTDYPWEVCNGTGGHWGYASEKPYRTYEELLQDLAEISAKGGNWLLNVAPRPTGELPASHMELLKQVGEWLKVNGESIYGTHRTKLGRQAFGWTTANDTTLFLHVLNWPGGKLVLEDLYDEAAEVYLLADKAKLPFTQERSTLTITLPQEAPDPADTVIAVRVAR